MSEVSVADTVNAKKKLKRIHTSVQHSPSRVLATYNSMVNAQLSNRPNRYLVTIANSCSGDTSPVYSVVHAGQVSFVK
jgi:hypothetical protein